MSEQVYLVWGSKDTKVKGFHSNLGIFLHEGFI